MSQITISAVLTCLRLAISLVAKVIRIIYAIMDLVDDGCINASAVRPDWMVSLSSVLNTIETVGSDLTKVEDQVYESKTK